MKLARWVLEWHRASARCSTNTARKGGATPARFALVLLMAAGGARAQPAGDAPPPPRPQREAIDDRPEGNESPEQARARMRERLGRAIENSRMRLERMQRAAKMLDEGVPVEQVRAALPEPEGDGTGPGRQGAQRRGPGGSPRPDARDPFDDRAGPGGGAERDFDGPPGGGGRPRGAGGPGGPGGPGGGPGGERERFGPGRDDDADGDTLTEERQRFLREFLSASNPGALPRLEELERRDPEAARRRFSEMWPRTRWLWDLRRRDPELFRLRLEELRHGREALDQAMWLARADEGDNERTERMNRLRTAVTEQQRVKNQILEHDVKRARERLESLQSELAQRAGNQDKTVDDTVRTMVDRAKDRARGGPPGRPDDERGGRPRGGPPDRDRGEPPPPGRD